MNFCHGWKAEARFSPVSWRFTEPHFLGWPAGGSHTHCCVLYTQYNTSTATRKNKSPLPFHHSCLPSLVWCDKATAYWWPLHLSATLFEWESVCFCVFLFCLCGVAAIYISGVWKKTTLTALAWPSFFFFFLTTVSLRGLCVMPASFANTVELWCAEVSLELVSESAQSDLNET